MQRTDAEKMLLQSPNGTFLIRFSEGDPGGISVAWVNGESLLGRCPHFIEDVMPCLCRWRCCYLREAGSESGSVEQTRPGHPFPCRQVRLRSLFVVTLCIIVQSVC